MESRRPRSPPCGRSILTTRAPRSASRNAQDGPARNWLKSRTSRPARGRCSAGSGGGAGAGEGSAAFIDPALAVVAVHLVQRPTWVTAIAQLGMHHLTGSILEGNVAVIARAQIRLIQGRQRVSVKVAGASIDYRVEPGGAMARLPTRTDIESALAVGAGDEPGVGDRQVEVLAATRDGEACAAESGAEATPIEGDQPPELQRRVGIRGLGVGGIAVSEWAIDDIVPGNHRLVGTDRIAIEAGRITAVDQLA